MTSALLQYAKALLKRGAKRAEALAYYGQGRYCPVCGRSSRRFRPFGLPPRAEAMCAFCHSLERHRLLWAYWSRETKLLSGPRMKMLHVAPEPCFRQRLRKILGDGYVTADIVSPLAAVRMDVTSIPCRDKSFDVVYCSHVLEHVLDDRKAMREFRRVLKPGGWAILLVPIGAPTTYEDTSIVDPLARERAFGQRDHVRIYGPDYRERLRESGFEVEVKRVQDLFDAQEAARMGLTDESGDIYVCTVRERSRETCFPETVVLE